MSHRLFVAVTLSSKLKDKIIEWEHSINVPVRWIIPENLHITLLPPWQESDVEKAKTSFQQNLHGIQSSSLVCRDISYGPDPLSPKLIWIACEPSDALRTIKSQLESIFASPRENRPYIPHITLARFPRRKWKKLQAHQLNIPFSWEEKIQSIQLIESELLPGGAHYRIVETVELP